jgi:dTDP-4-amino-4,6-dideoxygalactose transaminase
MNIYDNIKALEEEICKYTGSPYCVLIDNCSNAIFLSLMYEGIKGKTITIPSHTYVSVPCEIIHAGGVVKFYDSNKYLTGSYVLIGSKIIDSALSFTHNMYIKNTFMCLSFTGPKKILKLSKGGAILTDNKNAYEWFKKARYSGRDESGELTNMLGWNFMMLPEIATRGLMMMPQFYTNGFPIQMEDVTAEYPDLSKLAVFSRVRNETTCTACGHLNEEVCNSCTVLNYNE